MKLSPWVRTLLLSLWATAFVVPAYVKQGLNIVGLTFTLGSERLWLGQNPYAAPIPGTDVFHYPPLFPFLYYPFTFFPTLLHAVLFAFVMSIVFWKGLLLWVPEKAYRSPLFWVGLILCAMELDISLRYQQCNAAIVGMVLIALFHLKESNLSKAAMWFALGASLKIIPAFFVPFLAIKRPKLAFYFVLWMGIFFCLPALFLGFDRTWFLWTTFIEEILKDIQTGHGRRMLDIQSLIQAWGFPLIGKLLKNTVLLGTFILSVFAVFRKSELDWILWPAFLTCGILLFLSRTESATFVLLAPWYPLLLYRLRHNASGVVLTALFFIITFLYTSLWPSLLYSPLQDYWTSKSLGTLLVWIILVYVQAKQLRKKAT